MVTRILTRRDSTANWELINPVMKSAEMGVEIMDDGSRRIKTGDGITPWNDLPYSYTSVEEFEKHLRDSNAHGIEDITNDINGGIALINDSIGNILDVGNNLINRITTSESDIIDTASNLSSLENTVSQNRSSMENALNITNNNLGNQGNRITSLESWRNTMNNAFTDLGNTVTQNNNNTIAAINGITSRMLIAENGISVNTGDIESIRSDIEDIRENTDLGSLQTTIQRVNVLENDVGNLEYRSNVLETKVSNNINSIGNIQDGLTNVLSRVGNLETFDSTMLQSFNNFVDTSLARFDRNESDISRIDTSVTNLKWLTDTLVNMGNQNTNDIGTLRINLDDHIIWTQDNFRDVRSLISDESETRIAETNRLDNAIQNESETRQNQVDELHTAIENEAILRNQQITQAINNEAAARESQIYEVNNAMRQGFEEINGELANTNNVIDGIRTTSLHGAFLTRALGGTTDVPVRLFGSFTNFQAGKTLVFDDNGTQGVFIGNVDSATIRVMTKSISHMSDMKPTLLGSVPTRADLPETSEEAAAIFGRTPSIDDHAFVMNDETHDDLRVIWYVLDIVEIPYEGDAYGMIPFPPPPPTIVIVWGNPIPINRDDFQAQTTAVDSGLVLTGGATPGTFGESMNIDVDVTEESNNLVTSGAVYRAMERIREENSFSPDEVYTGTSWIDGRPIFRKVLTGETGTSSPTTFGFIENLGSFVDVRGHVINPYFIDNITTVDINFQTGELRGHWPEQGVINTPVWNWWNVGSPTINFAATGSHNNINGLNVGRLGGATGGITWGPAGFAMGGNRFTIGAVSPSGTTETTPTMRIPGVLDFTMPTLLEIDFGAASGAGAFQVSINNNTISMANSVHGNASRVVNQTMSGSGTFQHLIDTREWAAGREFLDSATITLRGEGTLTMQIFAIRLLRRTSWENSTFNLIFEFTRGTN